MRRPMCTLAVGVLLIAGMMLMGRSWDKAVCEAGSGEVRLAGKIADKQWKTTTYGSYWQLTLKNVILEKDGAFTKSDGRVLCRMAEESGQSFAIGQELLLSGRHQPWEEITNPGQFDMGKWYCSQGIRGQFTKCMVLKAGAEYDRFRESLWQFREWAGKQLKLWLGEKDGSLMSAMLLGNKSGLDGESKNLYQRNGISHILSISGLHLTLLGMGLFRGLQCLTGSIRKSAIGSGSLMAVYCIFTGSPVSTVRATVMFLLSLLAKVLGRAYDSLTALGVAAILLVFNNIYVTENSGFVLSFLAVLGVTCLTPGLKEMLGADTLQGFRGKVVQSLCVSLGASLMTLPVLLNSYGTYPWYSVFLNLLIVPPMAVLLFLAILVIVLSLPVVWSGASMGMIDWLPMLPAMAVKGILRYIEVCCMAFEKLSLQDGYIGACSLWQVVLYYVLLFGCIVWKRPKLLFWKKMILLSALQMLCLRPHFGVEITMLDVGQGDSIVIRSETNHIYLSDCGSSSVSRVGKYRLLPFLKYKGYGKIEGIFLSHLDEDHINGIEELLGMAEEERLRVKYLFLPASAGLIVEDEEKLASLLALAKKNETTVVWLSRGDVMRDGEMEIVCLGPTSVSDADGSNGDTSDETSGGYHSLRLSKDDRNNQSLVLSLSYGDFDMLLTGDMETAGEREVMTQMEKLGLNGKYEILKVAHHGSNGSSSQKFLEQVSPKVSLISCGKNNSYGHPHAETLERLSEVGSVILDTRECGAVRVRPKADGSVKVERFREGEEE